MLIEKKSAFFLNNIEKFQLFLHTRMCDACRNYQKQSKEIDSLLNNPLNTTEQPEDQNVTLSDEFKKQIISKIEKE